MSAHPDDPIRELLISAATIAIVGLSPDVSRDSHRVARYLQQAGYTIVPVNPRTAGVLGAKSWPSVAAIPKEIEIDIVDVFRRSDEVLPVVEEVIDRGTQPALWLQLGVSSPEAESRARNAGLFVVSDRCLMVEHRRRFPEETP